jgi:hypothetical protein
LLLLRTARQGKDLTYAFGYENLKPYYLGVKKGLSQKRNIKGSIQIQQNNFQYRIILRDLFGYNQYGLKSLAESVGLNKIDELDSYKTKMDKALIEKPELFIKYSMNDAELLIDIFYKKIDSFNELLDVL